ncbi:MULTISPECIES: crotonase/enoyl-CoA hydratase family protein [unclassified Nocardioides]|uniref:crotonase/enoyl-CoA hydratase family protein n=1 Tax=unclassified Nocardioides TaxID=2615069 RepID=UPI0006FED552|nr:MULTISPECIES: crotonase/enoyl-CoA hydratase family protein [unclassified Nocardioides]KQY57120.1 enoyl-CoA hydratase [Nocardioides sp. Root140]KQZ68628.1 enoyl-CoA hydratase [Nocardioides sp. Root151]
MEAFGVEQTGHVTEVTLLGPGKGNAMGEAFWRELPLVFEALDADDDVRAIVLTGNAKSFSVGLDLHEMMPRWVEALGPGAGARARARTRFMGEIRRLQAAVTSVAACRKPVIAAVSGWCIGGGVDLISAADVRLASANAVFSVREAKVAIVADVGSLHRLVGVIGEGHLRELSLTGKDIDAGEAERIGLVNRVFDTHEELLAGARAMANDIAANAPLAVQGTKQVLNEEREHRISAGLRHVSTWNAAFLPSADLNEAMAAFAQQRTPKFHGN